MKTVANSKDLCIKGRQIEAKKISLFRVSLFREIPMKIMTRFLFSSFGIFGSVSQKFSLSFSKIAEFWENFPENLDILY